MNHVDNENKRGPLAEGAYDTLFGMELYALEWFS